MANIPPVQPENGAIRRIEEGASEEDAALENLMKGEVSTYKPPSIETFEEDGGEKKEDGGEKKGGGEKDGGEKKEDGGEKDGGEKDGGEKDGGEKDGGEKKEDGGKKEDNHKKKEDSGEQKKDNRDEKKEDGDKEDSNVVLNIEQIMALCRDIHCHEIHTPETIASILGLASGDEDLGESNINWAYRTLAAKIHPDRVSGLTGEKESPEMTYAKDAMAKLNDIKEKALKLVLSGNFKFQGEWKIPQLSKKARRFWYGNKRVRNAVYALMKDVYDKKAYSNLIMANNVAIEAAKERNKELMEKAQTEGAAAVRNASIRQEDPATAEFPMKLLMQRYMLAQQALQAKSTESTDGAIHSADTTAAVEPLNKKGQDKLTDRANPNNAAASTAAVKLSDEEKQEKIETLYDETRKICAQVGLPLNFAWPSKEITRAPGGVLRHEANETNCSEGVPCADEPDKNFTQPNSQAGRSGKPGEGATNQQQQDSEMPDSKQASNPQADIDMTDPAQLRLEVPTVQTLTRCPPSLLKAVEPFQSCSMAGHTAEGYKMLAKIPHGKFYSIVVNRTFAKGKFNLAVVNRTSCGVSSAAVEGLPSVTDNHSKIKALDLTMTAKQENHDPDANLVIKSLLAVLQVGQGNTGRSPNTYCLVSLHTQEEPMLISFTVARNTSGWTGIHTEELFGTHGAYMSLPAQEKHLPSDYQRTLKELRGVVSREIMVQLPRCSKVLTFPDDPQALTLYPPSTARAQPAQYSNVVDHAQSARRDRVDMMLMELLDKTDRRLGVLEASNRDILAKLDSSRL